MHLINEPRKPVSRRNFFEFSKLDSSVHTYLGTSLFIFCLFFSSPSSSVVRILLLFFPRYPQETYLFTTPYPSPTHVCLFYCHLSAVCLGLPLKSLIIILFGRQLTKMVEHIWMGWYYKKMYRWLRGPSSSFSSYFFSSQFHLKKVWNFVSSAQWSGLLSSFRKCFFFLFVKKKNTVSIGFLILCTIVLFSMFILRMWWDIQWTLTRWFTLFRHLPK